MRKTTKQDFSFGIIPLKKERGEWEVLLVQMHQGHWGYPKGHPELSETPLEAAKRELAEETGLYVERLLTAEPFQEKYSIVHRGERVQKTVTYFLAIVSGDVMVQAHEIADHKWVLASEAENYVTFEEGKKLSRDIQDFLFKSPSLYNEKNLGAY